MADAFKYRIDHHGSLVRPPEVVTARARYAAGETSRDELHAVERVALGELVRRQRNLHLSVVTDGHVGRADRFDVVAGAVDGLELRRTHRGERWVACGGDLAARGPLVADDVGLMKEVTQTAVKVSLPAPSAMAGHLWDDEASSAAWGSPRRLGDALARIVRAEVERLFAAGARLVQLDNHRYAAALSPGSSPAPKLSLNDAIAVDTAAVDGLARPAGAAIGICPATSLGDQVDVGAAKALFTSVPVDRWVLPFHTGSEAELALLGAVPPERDACLGVVDASDPRLEDLDTVLARLDRAAELRTEEDMALSPNTGFADVADRPLVGADDQWRKLVHVETLARMFWGNEL